MPTHRRRRVSSRGGHSRARIHCPGGSPFIGIELTVTEPQRLRREDRFDWVLVLGSSRPAPIQVYQPRCRHQPGRDSNLTLHLQAHRAPTHLERSAHGTLEDIVELQGRKQVVYCVPGLAPRVSIPTPNHLPRSAEREHAPCRHVALHVPRIRVAPAEGRGRPRVWVHRFFAVRAWLDQFSQRIHAWSPPKA
jgi:hypothetical protein